MLLLTSVPSARWEFHSDRFPISFSKREFCFQAETQMFVEMFKLHKYSQKINYTVRTSVYNQKVLFLSPDSVL